MAPLRPFAAGFVAAGRRPGVPGAGLIPLGVVLLLAALPVAGAGPGSPPTIGVRGPAATPPGGLALTGYPTTGPAPLLVHFNLTVPNGTPPRLAWSFGDGTYLNGTGSAFLAPAHDYPLVGHYTCSVGATWSSGTENVSLPIDVVSPVLAVTVTVTPSDGPAPLTVGLRADPHGGSGTYLVYLWSFGDGHRGSGLAVRYTYEGAGDYRANFTVNDSQGSTATASAWVNVSSNRTASNSTGSNGTGSGPNSFRVFSVTVPAVLAATVAAGAIAVGLGAWVYVSRRRLFGPSGRIPRGEDDPPDRIEGGPVATSPTVGETDEPGFESEPPDLVPPVAGPAAETLSGGQLLTFRLVRHLTELPRTAPGDLGARTQTQAGIAEALGVQTSAVSRVLKRLAAAGLVAGETGHVLGVDRRVRVYRLTPRGERLGRALRESVPDPAPDGDGG